MAFVTARFDARTGYVVVLCALDNLTKGASGGAIQAANVALGHRRDRRPAARRARCHEPSIAFPGHAGRQSFLGPRRRLVVSSSAGASPFARTLGRSHRNVGVA